MSNKNIFDIDYDAITRGAEKRVRDLSYLSEIVSTEITPVLAALRKVADFVQELDDIGDTIRAIDFDQLPVDVRAVLNHRAMFRNRVDRLIGAGEYSNDYSLTSLDKYATANVKDSSAPLLIPSINNLSIQFKPNWDLARYPSGVWVCQSYPGEDSASMGIGASPTDAYFNWEDINDPKNQ